MKSTLVIITEKHYLYFQVPFDNNRLVFPPVAAAVLAYILYFPFTRSLPGGYGLAMFAGGLLGYVFYDLMHYYLHHGSPERDSYLHSLKHYHVLHHFDDHSTGELLNSTIDSPQLKYTFYFQVTPIFRHFWLLY